jgi:hypothetical protein
MTTDHDTIKAAALKLLAKGLITKAEAARLSGISRQLIGHWARNMPVDQAREAVVLKLWQRVTGNKG